ncbi:hypothetical protein TNIN_93721 [Trichonephila inaurata madagascariensis]|uniref:Uncharacterized protein n=1 Tax=Trichonephila inaurata madagascariensis TaxID=2747483 RepID=A0A8X6Y2D6_9ARAC|nr:hypothetical protein TNIN_93721 [Trichonephila inaurata madagascariensis]
MHTLSNALKYTDIRLHHLEIQCTSTGLTVIWNNRSASTVEGSTFCMTAIDLHQMGRSYTYSDIKATTVADAFYSARIARFGVPTQSLPIKDAIYGSSLFLALAEILGNTANTHHCVPPSNKG